MSDESPPHSLARALFLLGFASLVVATLLAAFTNEGWPKLVFTGCALLAVAVLLIVRAASREPS
jgi:uncharacterized membrane protein